MRLAKFLIPLVVAVSLILAASVASADNVYAAASATPTVAKAAKPATADDIKSVEKAHKSAMTRAKAIEKSAANAAMMDIVAVRKHVEGLGASIKKASKHFESAVSKMKTADKNKVEKEIASIRAGYKRATEKHVALKAETAKPKPDAKKISKLSADTHMLIAKADKDLAAIKKKLDIK